jgi:hypothetical protein
MRLNSWTAAATKQNAAPGGAPSRDIEPIAGGELDEGRPSIGLALRHLLRMTAYDPMAARAPGDTLARLRPFVDGARIELQSRRESGGTVEDHARGLAQLADGAVAGLCHVARFSADGAADSIVAPFTAVAVGGRGGREANATPTLDLLFLLPENAATRERAERMVAFVLSGLADLGFRINHASCTLPGAALLAEALPALTASLRDIRFVWGCYGLYADLANHLPTPTDGPRSNAA